jgi:hypothetical protein
MPGSIDPNGLAFQSHLAVGGKCTRAYAIPHQGDYMNRLTVGALSILLLGFAGFASAELKKLREWPIALPEPSPEIKKQYEYDPEAGATTSKLLSLTSRVFKDGAEINTQTTHYRNAMPVSGSGNWNTLLPVYHGFSGLFTSMGYKAVKLKYASSGPWPAKEFKIYTEHVSAQGVSKTASACKQIKSIKADRYFVALPGNIHVYECLVKFGGTSGDFTFAPDSQPWMNIYSDYLGVVMSAFYKDPQVIPGIRTEAEYKFSDINGREQVVVAEETDLRSKLSQL